MTAQGRRRAATFGMAALVFLLLAPAALAGTTIKGSYGRTVSGAGAQLNGRWVIAFMGNGRYSVALKGHIIGKGRISVQGGKATLLDSACKATQTGKYTYTLKGAVLTFTRISDPCSGRSAVLAKPLNHMM
jgi:hypothetical protein